MEKPVSTTQMNIFRQKIEVFQDMVQSEFNKYWHLAKNTIFLRKKIMKKRAENVIKYGLRHQCTQSRWEKVEFQEKKFSDFFRPRGWLQGGQGVVIWGA